MSGTRKPLTFDADIAPTPRIVPAVPKATKAAASKEARKQVGARVKADTYRQMKVRATMQDKTIGDLIEQAIAEFLVNHPA